MSTLFFHFVVIVELYESVYMEEIMMDYLVLLTNEVSCEERENGLK